MPLASEEFYLPEPRPLLSQGDIYLAPSVVVWSGATFAAAPVIPSAPTGPGETVYAPAWSRTAGTAASAPDVTLATSWTPVLVLSHDCEIDKEFNEHADALVGQGLSEEEAVEKAGARNDLDRYILVSPLLPYDERAAAASKWEAIRSAQKIGYFPLPPMPAYDGVEFLVHLSRITTVERRLLVPHLRAASLAEPARELLRFKLAEVLASRGVSLVSKLEAAIGHQIVEVRTLKAKRKEATVAVVLDDGSDVQVTAKPDLESPPPERTRRQ